MIQFKTVTYNSLNVRVIEARTDSLHDVRISVIGDKFGPNVTKYIDEFHDTQLEAEGFRRVGAVNGGLFFTLDGVTYANGIERVMGETHENDDSSWDPVMGFYHNLEGLPYIVTQAYIKPRLNSVRGAVAGAFGLLNNGRVDNAGSAINKGVFNAKSGRTIVGKRADGTLVLASFPGVTGTSGLTGPETTNLAKYLGMNNAVCMDGGGSVAMMFDEAWAVHSTRRVKNAVLIYVKDLTGFQPGDKVIIDGLFTVESVFGDKAVIKELGTSIPFKYLKKVS